VPDARLGAEGPPLTIASDVAEDWPDEWLRMRTRSTLAEGIAATLSHYRSLRGAG
jgi:hypothetical protein